MIDICCIGHITLDHIITPHSSTILNGGTSFYFSNAIAHMPHCNYKLVTSLASSEMKAVHEMRNQGIDVDVIESQHTVVFENKYGHNMNNRTQRVLAKADPFTVKKLQHVTARYIHLGSLLADDFPIEVFPFLAQKGILSVDAQGFLRCVEGQKVQPCDWKDKCEALKWVDILKVNEHEIETLTGHKEIEPAAMVLASWGIKEVLITLGSEGSYIYAQEKLHAIPAYQPQQVVDATGCGDTYATGYLYMRSQGASINEAGCFAAAMATLNLEKNGAFNGTLQQVKQVMGQN